MTTTSAWIIAATASLMLVSPAMARHYHHRHHGHPQARYGVMPDVLVANPYGDVIINGKTGFHRSDLGVMVPDSEPQSVVATGRASGSGLGAGGVPGSNWQ